MARLENALDTELRPARRETPFFIFTLVMALEDKMIDTAAFAKIALVVLPLVIVGNLLVELKECQKKEIGRVVG